MFLIQGCFAQKNHDGEKLKMATKGKKGEK